ncbi:MAG: hypothetical protein QXS17_03615, partial [Candidatus Micrarchaeaceae archaeon]
IFPPYSVTLDDNPPTGGNIIAGGTVYTNGQTANLIGTGTLNASPASGSIFKGWSASNSNVTFASAQSANTFLTVEGNSVVTANWAIPTPVTVTFNDIPASGYIVANGVRQNSGTTNTLLTYTAYTVNAIAPPGYEFAGWNATSSISVANSISANTTVTASGSGILTAVFILQPSLVVSPGANILLNQPPDHAVVHTNNGYYYLFYENNSRLYYSSSPDGMTWTNEGPIENPTMPAPSYDVLYDGNTIYVAYVTGTYSTSGTGTNVTVVTGTPNGATITFGAKTILQAISGYVGLTMTSPATGNVFVGFSAYNGSAAAYTHYIYNTPNSGSTWSLSDTFPNIQTATGTELNPGLASTQTASSNVLYIYGPYGYSTYNCTVYTNGAWSSVKPCLSKTSSEYAVSHSAVSRGGTIFFVTLSPLSGTVPEPIYLYSYTSSWSGATEIDPNNDYFPSISRVNANDLILTYNSMYSSSQYLFYRNTTNATATTWSSAFVVNALPSGNIIEAASTQANIDPESAGIAWQVSPSNAIYFSLYQYPGPFSVTFDDSPTTGNVIAAGTQLANGGSIQALMGGNVMTINALAPSAGATFSRWAINTANTANFLIANALSQNTLLTVEGSGNITALWNITSKFVESGLPSGTKWNVTYNGIINSSTTNTIVFSTPPGNYLFTVANQIVSGTTYIPSPSSGYLVAGNTTSITFSTVTQTCTISLPINAINFGSINPGSNVPTANAITDDNTGNANAYMLVYGGNWIGPGANSFGVGNTLWAATSQSTYSGTPLSATPSNTAIVVPAGSSNSIYFGLGVPGGAPSGSYSQTITIENSC